jgi:hypothetical protein
MYFGIVGVVLREDSLRGVSALLGSFVLMLSAALSVAPSAWGAWIGEGDPFCQPSVLHDYGKSFKGLPRAKPVRWRGEPPFLPPRATLSPPRTSVVLAGGTIEYSLQAVGIEYGGLALDWEVESRLVKVNFKGRAVRIAKRSVQRVGEVVPTHPVNLGFPRSPRPGIYRYTISFRKSGKLLGRYWDYYGVVRRGGDVRLALNGTAFRVGDEVLAKVENDSPEWLHYGVDYGIRRYEDGNWVPVELWRLFGHFVVFIRIGLTAEPGTVAECSSGFTVPETMSPGWYQMDKRIDISSDPNGLEKPLRITAEFQVE